MYVLYLIIDDKNPGPEKYEVKSLINGTGFNYVSKYKSSTAKSIHGKRVENPDKKHGIQ